MKSIEKFCDKMQLMNAEGYQGIFEAAAHKLNSIGGVMLWKLNAAFPSVVWQVYDWFLMPNAGYYFMQNACEPVHIQLNLINKKVTVVNRTYNQVTHLVSEVSLFDLNSKLLFHDEQPVSLENTDVKETSDLTKILSETKGLVFVVLNLKNSEGKTFSHNVYWLAPDDNYQSVNNLPHTGVEINTATGSRSGNGMTWTFNIFNRSDKIAFFMRSQVISGGDEVLPSFWSGNYFSLAPSESVTVSVTVPGEALKGSKPILKISGWNVEEQMLMLK